MAVIKASVCPYEFTEVLNRSTVKIFEVVKVSISKTNLALEDAALKFAKANKKAIAKRRTDKAIYHPEENPVSVFMAGSPGAGKTEASIELLDALGQSDSQVIRIDPDELRSEFELYDGKNSYLFQKGVSVLVEKVHDLALKQKQSFLLDGTLFNLSKARTNIQRSLSKARVVQILYVYQDPCLAWEFVQAREQAEGRRILLEHFIAQYFAALDNVNSIKREFGKQVAVDLLLKDVNNGPRAYEANIDIIDNHVSEKYTQEQLHKLLIN